MRVAARVEARAAGVGQQRWSDSSAFVVTPFRHIKRTCFRKLIGAMLLHCAVLTNTVNYNERKRLMNSNRAI